MAVGESCNSRMITLPCSWAQSVISITGTPTDVALTACNIDPSVLVGSILHAYVEIRGAHQNSNAAANGFSTGQGLYVSSDNGSTYPTQCVTLTNLCYHVASVTVSPVPACFQIVSGIDIVADVLAAIAGGFNLKFELKQATALQGSLNLTDVQVLLHVIVV